MRRVTSALVLTAMSAGSATAQSWGDFPDPLRTPRSQSPIAADVGDKSEHTLISTALSHGDLRGTVIPEATFYRLGNPKTLTCPNGGPKCRIEYTMNVQLKGNTASDNRFAFCPMLDGQYIQQPVCTFVGLLRPDPKASVFQTGKFASVKTEVGPGVHTVENFLYVRFGATGYYFETTYHLYK